MWTLIGHGVAALHQNSDVSVDMRAVLESVIDGGPQTVPQMARVRPVTRQHIQGLVNALLDGGCVEYVANPADKRSNLISPTERGLQTFREMRARKNDAFVKAHLDAMPEELEAATAVLRALIATFEGPEWQAVLDRYTADTEG